MEPISSGFGICRLCEGPSQPGYRICYCCSTLASHLRMPLAPVTAVTSYRLGDEMHRLLRGYKDASIADVRSDYTTRLAGMVAQWMGEHRDHLLARTQGPWDVVVGVPSSKRPAGAPVDALVEAVPELARCYLPLLVRGTEPTDHLVASSRGFVAEAHPSVIRRWPPAAACGLRALVVDDSLITGARAQSAVAALRKVRVQVAGVLVVGRVVAPETASWQAAYWESMHERRRAPGPMDASPSPGQRSPARTY
ncbi:MAG: phosphoribosyltransferase [Acidimicrobiales bacterium]